MSASLISPFVGSVRLTGSVVSSPGGTGIGIRTMPAGVLAGGNPLFPFAPIDAPSGTH